MEETNSRRKRKQTSIKVRPLRTCRESSLRQLRACRACLATGVRLLHMKDTRLTDAFETVTGLSLPRYRRLPPYICVYCSAFINSSLRFRKQCYLNQTIMKYMSTEGKLTLASIETSARGVGRTLSRSKMSSFGYTPDVCTDSRVGFVDTHGASAEMNIDKRTDRAIEAPARNNYDRREEDKVPELNTLDRNDHTSHGNDQIIDDAKPVTLAINIRSIIDSEINSILSSTLERLEKEPDTFSNLSTPMTDQGNLFEASVSSNVSTLTTAEDNLHEFEKDVKMEVLDETISETTPEQLGHEDNTFPNIDIDENFVPLSTEQCNDPSVSSDYKLNEERVHDSLDVDASQIHKDKTTTQKRKDKHIINKKCGKNIFICDVCNKMFELKHSLNRHLNIHTRRQRLNCDVCTKTFLSISEINRHKKECYLRAKFICDLCGVSYSDKVSLIIHIRRHNNAYKCAICAKGFAYVGQLRSHEGSHDSCGYTPTRDTRRRREL